MVSPPFEYNATNCCNTNCSSSAPKKPSPICLDRYGQTVLQSTKQKSQEAYRASGRAAGLALKSLGQKSDDFRRICLFFGVYLQKGDG